MPKKDTQEQDKLTKILIAFNEEDIKQLRDLLKLNKKLIETLEHNLNKVTNH